MLFNSLLYNKPIIHSKTADEDIINLGAKTFAIPNNTVIPYTVYSVSKSHVARPDLISQILYGTEMYGDLICKINGISNPFEINEGDILIVPSLDYMGEFMVTDQYDDVIGQDESKPKPKRKNEKRKANDAIVGDTRFKVDKDNRIIIY